MEKNSISRADEDHQFELGGGKEDSSRSGKMEAHSQGPMFQKERREISQASQDE